MSTSIQSSGPESYRSGPDDRGHFGIFGGRFVAETLMPLILAVEEAYNRYRNDAEFQAELQFYSRDYVGRPSPLYLAQRLSDELDGAKIYFKRDELNHTGAHKINNTLGQILLAKRMVSVASLPRPAPDNTGSRPQRYAPCLTCPVWSIWVKRISNDRHRMSFE